MNFIENYGQITVGTLKGQAAALNLANGRDTQNSSQMYTFLITSITNGLLGEVTRRSHSTRLGADFQDGRYLLKVIVTILHVDTRAQAGHICQCLARLSITILTPEYNCNIQKLNEHVVVLEEGLAARGKSSQDTMMNVQSAYMACKDADFVRHVKDEYVRWEQGAAMTLQEYMVSALIKYMTLKMKGLREAPSPEQEQIITLTAVVLSLRTKASKYANSKTGDCKKDHAAVGKDLARTTGTLHGKTPHRSQVNRTRKWSKERPISGAPITPTQ
jgi:hypothetical protein